MLYVPQHVCGSQRTVLWHWFSPSTSTWVVPWACMAGAFLTEPAIFSVPACLFLRQGLSDVIQIGFRLKILQPSCPKHWNYNLQKHPSDIDPPNRRQDFRKLSAHYSRTCCLLKMQSEEKSREAHTPPIEALVQSQADVLAGDTTGQPREALCCSAPANHPQGYKGRGWILIVPD